MMDDSGTALVREYMHAWPTSFTLVHISGSGGSFAVEGTLAYPDGIVYKLVPVLELAGGKVHAQRTYFAPEMEAPEWRSQWVERVQGGSQ